MHFLYNGTRDWFKIEWHNQSYVKLEVVSKNKLWPKKIPSYFRAYLYAFDLSETELYKQVSLAQIQFLLFLCDNSPAHEISHLTG